MNADFETLVTRIKLSDTILLRKGIHLLNNLYMNDDVNECADAFLFLYYKQNHSDKIEIDVKELNIDEVSIDSNVTIDKLVSQMKYTWITIYNRDMEEGMHDRIDRIDKISRTKMYVKSIEFLLLI